MHLSLCIMITDALLSSVRFNSITRKRSTVVAGKARHRLEFSRFELPAAFVIHPTETSSHSHTHSHAQTGTQYQARQSSRARQAARGAPTGCCDRSARLRTARVTESAGATAWRLPSRTMARVEEILSCAGCGRRGRNERGDCQTPGRSQSVTS